MAGMTGTFEHQSTLRLGEEGGRWPTGMSVAATTDGFSFRASKMRSGSHTRSAPMLPAANSTQGSTWYSGGCSLASSPSKRSLWKPLGGTWRDWETDSLGSRVRTCADDGSAFISGCVPNWSKETTIRTKGLLAHELTWAYYQMRRHPDHPVRKEVGESLAQTDVVSAMRTGASNAFHFWRDLRPPFAVLEVHRVDDLAGGVPDPEGELFKVVYECGLDYRSERLWGAQQDGGTFDNRVHGVAKVRIPVSFPQRKPLRLLSWGRPQVNWQPKLGDDEEYELPDGVPPEQWMPIADEIGQRADSPRLAQCRIATRAASRKAAALRRRTEVPDLQRLLLGPHAQLASLAMAEDAAVARDAGATLLRGPAPRMKQRTIFTAAAGFVRYTG